MTDIDKAASTLLDAAERIRKAGAEHGDCSGSFSMLADMWTSYISHACSVRSDHKLRPADVAQMLAMLKIVRSIYGNSHDNFVDQAGYTALASMLIIPGA